MDLASRVDPDLAVAFAGFTGESLDRIEQLQAVRRLEAQDAAALRANRPRMDGVDFADRVIEGSQGLPLAVRLYRSLTPNAHQPVLLWLHGGGYLLGTLESDYLLCSRIARDLQCAVLAVDYRLAPEHPFPAALDDAHAALQWLRTQAGALGIDPARIAIGGASAGAGLAAGLALLNRDRGGATPLLQLLIYPMLDDRNETPSSREITDARVWDRTKNLYAWRCYLGSSSGGDTVSPYAAPARAADLHGLPPTYLAVGALDLFVDEDVAYAARLLQAGVPTELQVYPGAFHSFDGAVPSAPIARRFTANYLDALARAWGMAA